MKVTDIKTFTVDCFRTNWVFVKVYTDEGIDGVGEATLEYKEKALIGSVEHIKEYLVGQNPLDIEKHWHAITVMHTGVGERYLCQLFPPLKWHSGTYLESTLMCPYISFWAAK